MRQLGISIDTRRLLGRLLRIVGGVAILSLLSRGYDFLQKLFSGA